MHLYQLRDYYGRRLPRGVKSLIKECQYAINMAFAGGEAFATAEAPRLLVNSVPKSGTNLLLSYFSQFPIFSKTALHVDRESILFNCYPSVRKGQFITGHLPFCVDQIDNLVRRGVKPIFIYRDPRALVVSAAHYIIEKDPSHRLHHFGLKCGFEALCDALVFGNESGVGGPIIDPLHTQLSTYRGWLNDSRVFSMSYEELITSDIEKRECRLRQLWEFVSVSHVDEIDRNLLFNIPNDSRTMRRGVVDAWKQELSPVQADNIRRSLESEFSGWFVD